MGFELACMQATFFNTPPEFSYTAATAPALGRTMVELYRYR